jgi:hypothetical protein
MLHDASVNLFLRVTVCNDKVLNPRVHLLLFGEVVFRGLELKCED